MPIAKQFGFWQSNSLFMEKSLCKWLALGALCVLACTAAVGAQNVDPTVARYHFIGGAHVTGTNGVRLKHIWTLPSTGEYRDLVLKRISAQVTKGLSASGSTNDWKLIRLLFDDLILSESA